MMDTTTPATEEPKTIHKTSYQINKKYIMKYQKIQYDTNAEYKQKLLDYNKRYVRNRYNTDETYKEMKRQQNREYYNRLKLAREKILELNLVF